MSNSLSLLAVYAHPDDEQGVSGLMAKYARQGVNTGIICATRGEAGEIAPGTHATPETLGQAREAEMRCAAAKIGVRHLYLLNYRDSGMADTPENQDPRCLYQANVLEVAAQVTRIVREQKPQVMIAFDAWGGYGHPDHIKMHQAALMAFWMAADARNFPEQLADGLETWAPSKLYFNAWPRSRFRSFVEYLKAQGEPAPDWLEAFAHRALPDEVITTRLDVHEFVDLKIESLMCHATQLGPNTMFRRIPESLWRDTLKVETLALAESRTGRAQNETDIFEGIV